MRSRSLQLLIRTSKEFDTKMLCTKCRSALMADIQVPSFPVADLIQKTRVSSESEVDVVRRTLSRARTDILRLDDEIKQLQETMEELFRVRKVLCNYAKENEAILTPIEKLPPELLSEIFKSLLPVQRKEVMLPAQICSHWREVALSTPELYTSIFLQGTSVESEAALIKAWLSRSGALPLSLHFVPFRTGPGAVDFSPAIDEALPYSDRWQSMALAYPVTSISNLDVIKGRLQCLEYLYLNVMGDLDAQRLPIDAFEIAPQLRSLRLPSTIPPHAITVPWAQLSEFTVHGHYSLGDCLEVLSLCPNLATCSLEWGTQPFIIQRPPIRLLHLHSLEMEAHSSPAGLFKHLSLPALRSCQYFHDHSAEWNHSEFISLLSRSHCSLQQLNLYLDIFISDEDLILCLEHLPNLVELEIISDCICELPSMALARLTLTDNDQAACLAPKLEVIKLVHHSTFDNWAFIRMIQSRWRLKETMRGVADLNVFPAQIKTVQLRSPDFDDEEIYIDSEVLERLLGFKNEGLDIIL